MSAEDIQGQQGLSLPGGNITARVAPPDIIRQLNMPGQRATQVLPQGQTGPQPAPNLPPSISIGTEAIYSTLPANAGNINETQQFNVNSEATPGLASNVTIWSYIVPQGRVLYTRAIRVNIIDSTIPNGDEPPVQVSAGIPPGLFTFGLFRNNGVEVFNQNIALEPLDEYNPIFLVGAPGDLVQVRVSYDYTLNTTIPEHVIFLTHMQGELLTPNNMPVPYTALKPKDAP